MVLTNQSIPHTYMPIDLSSYWEDSVISQVFISENILSYLTNTYILFHDSTIRQDVEQGGFLLGNYHLDGENYTIKIDHFINVESDNQSSTNIEFSSRSWSVLDQALDAYPGQKLVGWFHTHPGHGIFLSEQDLNISNTFFNKPYQIALLLDNQISQRNKQLELGIFSFKRNGKMNNY